METLYRENYVLHQHLSKEEVLTQFNNEGVDLLEAETEVVHEWGNTYVELTTDNEALIVLAEKAVGRIEVFLKLVARIEEAQQMRRDEKTSTILTEDIFLAGVDSGYQEVVTGLQKARVTGTKLVDAE